MHTEFRHATRNELATWLESGERNQHFHIGPLSAYCRRSRRICGPCLDIATIDVIRSRQKKGYGTAFLEEAESVAGEYGLGLFVECVGNRHLQRVLTRMGLGKLSSGSDVSPNFVKPHDGIMRAKGNETKYAR